jgi:hypothetical protein
MAVAVMQRAAMRGAGMPADMADMPVAVVSGDTAATMTADRSMTARVGPATPARATASPLSESWSIVRWVVTTRIDPAHLNYAVAFPG